MSTCTCLDATLHATICKHIHLVHMETSDNVVCKVEHQQILSYFMYSLPKVKKYLETPKETLLLKIYTLEMTIRKCIT